MTGDVKKDLAGPADPVGDWPENSTGERSMSAEDHKSYRSWLWAKTLLALMSLVSPWVMLLISLANK